MNAYQYLATIPHIHYHNLLLAKKYDGWQWAVDTYCPKELKGKLWMIYLDKVINQEAMIYDIWRYDMRYKMITIPQYDDKDPDRVIRCSALQQYYKELSCIITT